MSIKFGEWLPDMPVHNNPGALTATNVLPFRNKETGQVFYRQMAGKTVFSGAANGARVQGAANAVDTNGNYLVFAGTSSTLEKLNAGGVWEDISDGLGYNTAGDGLWQFAQWGNDVLASNHANNIQKYTLGVSSAFADLDVSAPRARYMAQIRDFIIAGNTFDSVDADQPSRVRWSAIGDPSDWTVDAATQSDYQDLNSAKGWVQGIVGGQYGVVLQEKAIWRMEYQGSPDVFRFDEVEPARGCLVPSSIAQIGHFIFFISQDGFYVFDRSESRPIGSNKFDKTFFSDFNQDLKDRVSVSVDPINKLIMWGYVSIGAVNNKPDKIVVYNWESDCASILEIDHELLLQSVSLGYTLETLDTYNTNIDAIQISLDSRFWTGGEVILAAFDREHKLNYFSGSPLVATLETTEFSKPEITEIQRVRPDVDASTVTVRMGRRSAQGDSVEYSTSLAQEPDGSIGTRSVEQSRSRHHRIEVTLPNGFSSAQGVDIMESTNEGERDGT